MLRRPPDRVGQRPSQLRDVGHPDRRADFGDQLGADVFRFLLQRLVQLHQAALPELVVGRPVGGVERAAGGGDGLLHVLGAGVGGEPEHFLIRRIDVVDGLPGRRIPQPPVDKQPGLGIELDSFSGDR